MIDFSYENASKKLREVLTEEDKGKVNGFEFLTFYLADTFEGDYDVFSDYGREEIEGLVSQVISEFEAWLKSNASDWLDVGDRYRWVLRKLSEPKEGRVLEQPTLGYTEEEKLLLSKEFSLLEAADYKIAKTLYEKSLQKTENEKIADRALRLAWIAEKMNVPYLEKANFWEEAGDKTAESERHLGFSWYVKAAELHGRNLSHFESSRIYEKAVERGGVENIENDRLMEIIRACKQQYILAGDGDGASRAFIKENDIKLGESKRLEWFFLKSYKVLCNYGESPKSVVSIAVAVVLFSSLFYYGFGIYSSKDDAVVFEFFTSLYFSLVTFTTLGYGDYSPHCWIVSLVSSLEAVTGLLLTSLFLATVIRKYSR